MDANGIKELIEETLKRTKTEYTLRGSSFYFALGDKAHRVPCAWKWNDFTASLYAKYGFKGDPAKMAIACNKVNRTISRGMMVADEKGGVYYRCVVSVFDDSVENTYTELHYCLSTCLKVMQTHQTPLFEAAEK